MPIFVDVPRGMNRIVMDAQQRVRMAFFGTPGFAVPALRALIAHGWPVELVVTAPDKPVGRRAVLTPSAVSVAAGELGIRVRTPVNLKDESFWAEFSEFRPDVCIVAAYGKLIPKRYLDTPRLGFLNIHPSLLPMYRGPSPIQTAILDGATTTGVSIMLLDEEMDHGPIIAQETWDIPGGFDAGACETELARIGAGLLLRILPSYADGSTIPAPQDHAAATFTHKFTRADGRLDWNLPCQAVYNRIRALGDEPGTWTTWNGSVLNIIAAHPAPTQHAPEGRVVRTEDGIGVGCQTGILMVDRVQPEGGTAMDATAFANGRPEFIGSSVV